MENENQYLQLGMAAAGDYAHFGGVLGESVIMNVNTTAEPNPFIRRGGLIPSAIHSLKN